MSKVQALSTTCDYFLLSAAMEAPLSDVPNPANADEGRGRKKKGRAGRRGGGSSQSDLQQLEGPGVGREAGGGGGAVALSAPGRQVVETLMAGADAEFMVRALGNMTWSVGWAGVAGAWTVKYVASPGGVWRVHCLGVIYPYNP